MLTANKLDEAKNKLNLLADENKRLQNIIKEGAIQSRNMSKAKASLENDLEELLKQNKVLRNELNNTSVMDKLNIELSESKSYNDKLQGEKREAEVQLSSQAHELKLKDMEL